MRAIDAQHYWVSARFERREEGDASGLERILYEDTDYFQITRNFLNRRQMFLDILWSED